MNNYFAQVGNRKVVFVLQNRMRYKRHVRSFYLEDDRSENTELGEISVGIAVANEREIRWEAPCLVAFGRNRT